MCARYTLSKAEKDILEAYAAELTEPFVPNYNLAPTQKGAVITADDPNLIQQYRFGLVPHWATDKKAAYKMLNARQETLFEKPSFKPLMLKNKRCLILADSFYEWEDTGTEKLPYRFILPDRPIFAFAGLYSWWKDKATEDWYKTFTIITTEPNEMVGKLHDRMPVILTKEEEQIWLNGDVPMKDLIELCNPFPAVEMDIYRVSKEVNNVKNNHCDLILPENSK